MRQLWSPSSLARSVEPTTSMNSTVASTRSVSAIVCPLPGDELLDGSDQVRLGERPVVRAVTLEQRRARDVLREVAAVTDA